MNNLPEERLLREMEKTFMQADQPSRFFKVLDEIGALETTFPELHALKGVPAGPPEYHKESAFEHTMMVLDEMAKIHPFDKDMLLIALSHDLGKGRTPDEDLPSHPNHESRGADVAQEMADRLSMSNKQEKAMTDASRYHTQMLDIDILKESTVIDMLLKVNVNVDRLITLAQADVRGREPQGYFDAGLAHRRISAAHQAMDTWTGERLIEEGYSPEEMGGKEFGDLLRQKRVEEMRELETGRKS